MQKEKREHELAQWQDTAILKRELRQTEKEFNTVRLDLWLIRFLSPWTKQSYKVIIKKFYKWLKFGDEYRDLMEYPKIVSWLRTNFRKKDKPKIKAGDILTEDEVKTLIDVAEHARDKAFISMFYELGARIGEIGGLFITDLTRDKYGYIVDWKAKPVTERHAL